MQNAPCAPPITAAPSDPSQSPAPHRSQPLAQLLNQPPKVSLSRTVSATLFVPFINNLVILYRNPSALPIMKVSNASLLALLLPAVSARFVEAGESDRVMLYPDGIPTEAKDTQKYHIELGPGETRWVTEDEKWELRRVSLTGTRRLSLFRLLTPSVIIRMASASLTSPTTPTSERSAPARPPSRRVSFPTS